MQHKITYFLFYLNKETTLKDFNILLSAINTQSGIGVIRSEESRREATIIYGSNPLRADIKFTLQEYGFEKKRQTRQIRAGKEGILKTKIKVPKNRISLTCELADNLTVNFIKEVGRIQGLKVFAPHLGYFLPKDPNLHDCNTGIENSKELQLLEKFDYKPLFWYWNSFTYYAKSLYDKKIHIINGHLLKHLVENDIEKVPKDFSCKIANSLEDFVRMANIGILPLDYYKCVNNDFRFYNMSSIDLEDYKSEVFLDITAYAYDKKILEYKKVVSERIVEKEITRPFLPDKFEEVFESVVKNDMGKLVKTKKTSSDASYTGAIVEKDIEYKMVNKKYVPKLNVALFL